MSSISTEQHEPIEKEKKKRGRKPKPKSEVVIKEKKKRGRKPKIKVITEDELNKFVLPSKRGRKPKDKVGIFDKNLNLDSISNCILHLPIPLNKLEEIDNNTHNEINPYDPFLITNDIETTPTLSTNNCIYSNVTYTDNESENTTETVDENTNEDMNNYSNVIKNIYNKETVKDTNIYNDNYIKRYQVTHNTNVKCNWCLYECNNEIFKLPYILKQNEINYYGNFCCPECAAAFNFNELNDEYIWERYSLLNYLYNKSDEKLSIAPSRLVLDIFGGPLTIDEYRNIISTKKHVNVIMPPHYIICPQIDVSQNCVESDGFIPLNLNRINKYTSKLKLKKPATPMNTTLDTCMNLKCI